MPKNILLNNTKDTQKECYTSYNRNNQIKRNREFRSQHFKLIIVNSSLSHRLNIPFFLGEQFDICDYNTKIFRISFQIRILNFQFLDSILNFLLSFKNDGFCESYEMRIFKSF